MRANTKRHTPHARLFAIAAALVALSLAIGACSLSLTPTSGTGGSGANTSGGSVSTGSGQSTPVKILHGGGGAAMILVPITIDGHGPYNFALDTGAGITLIDTQLADTLQLPVTGDSGNVAGVGGSQAITPVHVDSWSAGKITLPAADVASTNLPSFRQNSDVHGLLGSDILSRFGRITINYDTGELSVSGLAAAKMQATPLAPDFEAALPLREATRPRAA
jgi:aspartyl protease